MPNVVQAIDKLLHGLELTEKERADVPRQAKAVISGLQKNFEGIDHDLLAGSFSRDTAIRPLLDVVLLVVLDPSRHAELREAGPAACLEKLQIGLSVSYPSSEPPRIQGRGLNFRKAGASIGFDVIPAFAQGQDVYLIPDRTRTGWIPTNPKAQQEISTRAHEKAGAKLRPLIRAAKHWNQINGKPLEPFHLELLAGRAVPTPPLNYLDAFQKLFSKSSDSMTRGCPDPAGVGPDIDEGLDREHRTRGQLALKEALRHVDQALQLERAWKNDEAHRTWRTLFGDAYPETGRK